MEEAHALLSASILDIKKEIDPDRPMTFLDMDCIAQELDQHILNFDNVKERLTAKTVVENATTEKKAPREKRTSTTKKTSRHSTTNQEENVK